MSIKDRLKLKAHVENAEECGIPAWAMRYNGKPCMITKSNTITRFRRPTISGREVEVVECDIDLRVWSLLCRQGVNAILPLMWKIDVVLALLVQGESDDELPERVMGGVRLSFLDLGKVPTVEV